MAKMTDEHKAKLMAGKLKAEGQPKKTHEASKVIRSKSIRLKCLDCSGSSKMIKYCPSDGIHSTYCPLWYHRFGCGIGVVEAKYGKKFVTPSLMPSANICIDDIKDEDASEIGDIEGSQDGKE